MAQTKLTIALDFGTTFSGIAWATPHNAEEPEVIIAWPGGNNRTSDKVPTTITYNYDENHQLRILWGFQIPRHKSRLSKFKLLLEESQKDRRKCAEDAKSLIKALGKSAIDVSADFLQAIFAVAKQQLERRYSRDFVRSVALQVILTVPAVWSDKAKDATLKAAHKAGLGEYGLALLSEPEAAALYTLRSIRPNHLMEGDSFVVCDAGGGTIDLITYRIKSVDPFNLVEVVPGSGGICGAATLDVGFENLVKKLLGTRWDQFTTKGRATMLASWIDEVKCSFGADDELDEYILPVPGVPDDPHIGIERGMMTLEPVVQEVESLVRAQVNHAKKRNAKIKAVLLVGGFGASPFLFEWLKAKFPRLQIMQPPNAWTAVVRGAVLRGVQGNQVTVRMARRHYGVAARSKFDAKKHKEAEKYWDELEEAWKVDGNMTWFVTKGMQLNDNHQIRYPFYRTMLASKPEFIFEAKLYFCEDDTSPKMFNGKSIFKLCEVTSDLSDVPKELFEKRTNSEGTSYYHVQYNLVMTLSSASIVFSLEFNGIPYGGVCAKY